MRRQLVVLFSCHRAVFYTVRTICGGPGNAFTMQVRSGGFVDFIIEFQAVWSRERFDLLWAW